MEKHSWGFAQWLLRVFDNGPKQIKDLLGGHYTSCLKRHNNNDPFFMMPMLVMKKK